LLFALLNLTATSGSGVSFCSWSGMLSATTPISSAACFGVTGWSNTTRIASPAAIFRPEYGNISTMRGSPATGR
jgi:hypothetical protein